VREVAGERIHQVVVGSSANPGLRDFGIVAMILDGKHANHGISLDINPTSRQTIENLIAMGHLGSLVRAGARVHQAGCLGCIGMGQAPASDQVSLRTMPRNFPGRSGTSDDRVYLCSPETAAASALTGEITDPRDLEDIYSMRYPRFEESADPIVNTQMLVAPADGVEKVELFKGPNIESLPDFDPLPDELRLPVLLKADDDVSTDEIMPAGQRVLPFRSNIPKMSDFAFTQIDPDYPKRAREQANGHAIIGGHNYGQGSSREHAAVVPRYLGLRVVIARSFARIHWQNLANFGILALEFEEEGQWEAVDRDDILEFRDLKGTLRDRRKRIEAHNATQDQSLGLVHNLTERQISMVLAGGLIPALREKVSQDSDR
jgi:aconitate hydratase